MLSMIAEKVENLFTWYLNNCRLESSGKTPGSSELQSLNVLHTNVLSNRAVIDVRSSTFWDPHSIIVTFDIFFYLISSLYIIQYMLNNHESVDKKRLITHMFTTTGSIKMNGIIPK